MNKKIRKLLRNPKLFFRDMYEKRKHQLNKIPPITKVNGSNQYTVVSAIYNAEKYLHNCIQSVINQSYLHWKLILVNDGSTDASLEICQDFAKKDSRIVFFSQTNKGQAAARNFGVSQVTTPYVTFLDADDAISSDTLSSNMEILVNNTTIDCLQYPIYWSYETFDQHKTIQKQELISDNFYKNWLIKKKISWIVCNKIFKTTIFNHLSFKEGIVYEDNLFVAGMLSFINSIFILFLSLSILTILSDYDIFI